jgi:hypothetical protein
MASAYCFSGGISHLAIENGLTPLTSYRKVLSMVRED